MQCNEVRTTFMLNAELRKKVRVLAIENGDSLVGIVRKALERYIQEHSKQGKPLRRVRQ